MTCAYVIHYQDTNLKEIYRRTNAWPTTDSTRLHVYIYIYQIKHDFYDGLRPNIYYIYIYIYVYDTNCNHNFLYLTSCWNKYLYGAGTRFSGSQ